MYMEANFKETGVSKQIIDISQELFQQKGYKAFSYRDLSKLIGIKTSSIHYYFHTKDDLALALVIRYKDAFRKERELIDKKSSDPKSKLKLYFELFIKDFRKNKRICFCSMLASDYSNLPDAVKHEVVNIFRDNIRWISGVLRNGLQKKIFNMSLSPDELAEVIFSSFEGATITARLAGDESTILNTYALIQEMIESKNKGFISKYLSMSR